MIHLLCPNPALDRTLLIEEYKIGGANRPIETKDFPGGKSFNVAYAIQRTKLNTPFKIHTLLGGPFGAYVEQLAEKNNYPVKKTKIDSNTRICSIVANVKTHEVYPLYEKGYAVQEENVKEYMNNILIDVQDGDTIALSGSFLPGFSESFLKELSTKLSSKSIKLCIDTSGKPLRQAFCLNPLLIKINDEELLDIFPDFQGESVNDYMQFFKENWNLLTEYFIVTIGKEGVVAKMKDRVYHLKSRSIKAKNPIASGDFFFGTLISNLMNNKSSKDSLTAAISASTANCLNWYPEFTDEQFAMIKDEYIEIKSVDSKR